MDSMSTIVFKLLELYRRANTTCQGKLLVKIEKCSSPIIAWSSLVITRFSQHENQPIKIKYFLKNCL